MVAAGRRHSPPRVLVAEDDAEMRRLVIDVLQGEGYEVREASDGGRLIIAITAQHADPEAVVDLIISDVRMPICTGLQVVENLRQTRWNVPVILMTAFGDVETRKHATRLGAVLLDKPLTVESLRVAVRSLLARA
jgi:DNA-binding response OmpR family regulator